MEQYIPKSALVAEIERRKKIVEKRLYINNSYSEEGNAAWKRDKALYDAYNSLLSSLDTLDVKEVDLNEEIESYFKGFGKFASVGIDDCIDIAKYFFELGLKAQKGE